MTMSKVNLPSSFIRLPVVQNLIQDDVCKHCERYILEMSSNSIHFQCEGRFCNEAYEHVEDTWENISFDVSGYAWKAIRNAEAILDGRIKDLELLLNNQMQKLNNG